MLCDSTSPSDEELYNGTEVRLIVAPISCLLNAAAFNGSESAGVQRGIEDSSSAAAGLSSAQINPRLLLLTTHRSGL